MQPTSSNKWTNPSLRNEGYNNTNGTAPRNVPPTGRASNKASTTSRKVFSNSTSASHATNSRPNSNLRNPGNGTAPRNAPSSAKASTSATEAFSNLATNSRNVPPTGRASNNNSSHVAYRDARGFNAGGVHPQSKRFYALLDDENIDAAENLVFQMIEKGPQPVLDMIMKLFIAYLNHDLPSHIEKLVAMTDENIFTTTKIDKIYHLYTPREKGSEKYLCAFLDALQSRGIVNSTKKIQTILQSHPDLAKRYPEFAGKEVINSISQRSATQTTSISSQSNQVADTVDIFSLFELNLASLEEENICKELEDQIYASHQKNQEATEEAFNTYIQNQHKPSFEMIANLIRIFSCNDQSEKIKQLMNRFDPKLLTVHFWVKLFCAFEKDRGAVRENNSRAVEALLEFLIEKKISFNRELDFIFVTKYSEHTAAYNKFLGESEEPSEVVTSEEPSEVVTSENNYRIGGFFAGASSLSKEGAAVERLTRVLKNASYENRATVEKEFELHLKNNFGVTSNILAYRLQVYAGNDLKKASEILSEIKLELFSPNFCVNIFKKCGNYSEFLHMFLLFLAKNNKKVDNLQVDKIIYRHQHKDSTLVKYYKEYKASFSA